MTLVDYIKKNRIAVGGLLFIALIVLIVVMLLSPGGEEQPESDRTTSSSSGITAPSSDLPASSQDASLAVSSSDVSRPDSASSSAAPAEEDSNPTHKGEAVRTPWEGAQLATFITNRGEMTFLLFPEEAPRSVENFVNLANAGLYNGVSFGRPIGGAYITVTRPENATVPSLPLETDPTSVWHYYGALGYSGDGAAQFRIVTLDTVDAETLATMRESGMWPEAVIDHYAEVGGIPGYDDRYTVFGQLIEGAEVLAAIVEGGPVENDGSDSSTGGVSGATTIIESIEISTYHA